MIEDKIKIEQTSWKEIRREIGERQEKYKPRYFVYFESHKGRLENTIKTGHIERDYALALSSETAKLFEERGYYEFTERMFASSVRNEKLPIFYCSHEKDLAQKTLKRLFVLYK